MAFYLGKHLFFLDSFQFMSSGLAKLANNLPEDKFIYTRECFTDKSQFQLMRKKGVYPYEYIDTFEKFDEKKLPKKEDFYLTNKEASTALCSVVKHAGSGRARKKCRGKHEKQSSVFPTS